LRCGDATWAIDLNVLYTCKQLNCEATSILHHRNTLEVEIDSMGTVASLHFSKHHSICEYRAPEAITEVASLFLEKFQHFQFRFLDARRPDSLRKAIKLVQRSLVQKHVTVIAPSPRLPRLATQLSTHRLNSRYPRVDSALSCFSILRCASFSVRTTDPDQDPADYHHLVDLVTGDRPQCDMVEMYYDLQRSVRAVDKMLLPSSASLPRFDMLYLQLLEHMRDMSQSANRSEQDAFLRQCKEFEDCYCQIQELD
jgi:hypothetical protein